ncbi:MAG: HAMP domain-containing protein [Desulfuromonadales bacterium]|nr:HAMP domain-containing protein [Desulfuromonadales bacterium]
MARYYSLHAKLIILTFSLLIGFGLTLGVYLKAQFADHLSRELLKRGISIAHHLSTLSANAFIEGDTLYLDYLAKEHRRTEDDIEYIFMLDSHGQVLAHSFDGSYPVELAAVNPLPANQTSSLMRIDTGAAELIYDVAVPVLDGRPGSIHLGVSAAVVSRAVNNLLVKIFSVIGLVGLLALGLALLASQKIARPIARLTEAVKALAEGARSLSLPVSDQDEVGQLTMAFNGMVKELGLAEQRLVYQKHFLESLLDDIPVPVFYKNTCGHMLGCNRAYCEFWGWSRQAVVNRRAEELYAAMEADVHSARDVEVMAGEQEVRYELNVTDAAGQKRQIIFHKAPLVDQESGLTGIVGVMLDVTLERQVEAFRREFVSTVAHEFQTPLATIIGFADLLLQTSLEGQNASDALQTIMHKAEALSGMVDELLDLTRIESGKSISIDPILIDLRPILNETLDNFRTSFPSHELLVSIPADRIEIRADRERLVQVVDNLLSNAVKYSPPGSQVVFTAEHCAKGVRLTIADQGVGMTAEQRSHLFEKFYRADPSNTAPHGTGLGLYICKVIIDAHGGDIDISSAPNQGTTVVVTLP